MKLQLTAEDISGNEKYLQWLKEQQCISSTKDKVLSQLNIGGLIEILSNYGVIYSIGGKVFSTGAWKLTYIASNEYTCENDELIDSLWEACKLMIDESSEACKEQAV